MLERTAERPQARHDVAFDRVEQHVVVVPMRLLSSVSPSTRPFVRRTSNTENGRRSRGADASASLDHDELAGSGCRPRCREPRGR